MEIFKLKEQVLIIFLISGKDSPDRESWTNTENTENNAGAEKAASENMMYITPLRVSPKNIYRPCQKEIPGREGIIFPESFNQIHR
ncbi:MAG: hypothetical protein AB7W47_09430 [Calditrichaceae bacterium]